MPGLPWPVITVASVSSHAVNGTGPQKQNATSITARRFMKMRAVAPRQAPCWKNGIGNMGPAYARQANRRLGISL